MTRFVEGEDRAQGVLLPEFLDDYVAEDNPVRVIDVFVDELDLRALGFDGVVPETTGRPAYHPATMLKIYLYGYLNRIQSSRRLERESQRNIELMWLTGRLMPDFKTIADFRRDSGPAIRAACAQFIVLCRQFNLFTRTVVAIDGSKFKAVNNRDKNFTVAKVAKRIEQVEASIARYLAALDRADREDGDVAEAKTVRLKEKIEGLRRQMQSLKEIGQQVEAPPDKQVSLTDPDARSMATSGKGTGIVGYNVQIAVDAEHHFIVAHDVTNVGSDRAQLTAMSRKAREASGCEEVTVLADRGYYNGDEVLACGGTGILPVIPKTQTSGNAKRGLFTVADFVYDAENDRYTCPAGEHLTKGKARSDRRDNIDHYRNLIACLTCVLKPRCTPDKQVKRLKRWEHEGVLDKMQARLDHMPEAMTIRRQTVEHPFGTLKAWRHPLRDQDSRKGQDRDEPAGAGLQYEANDQHLWRQPANAGDRNLTTRVSQQAVAARNT
jgi:transposase